MWANIFLPYFHAHEIMCALLHHLLPWVLTHRNQIFHRPEPLEESYNTKIGYWQQHTLPEKQDIFQFWESKGLSTYVQTVTYVLDIAHEWETFYMTLWEENNKSPGAPCWETWRLKLLIFLCTDQMWSSSYFWSLSRGHQAGLDDRG